MRVLPLLLVGALGVCPVLAHAEDAPAVLDPDVLRSYEAAELPIPTFAPLEILPPKEYADKRAAGLKAGDYTTWLHMFGGSAEIPARVASEHFILAAGRFPSTVEEVSPYLFLWPVADQQGTHLVPLDAAPAPEGEPIPFDPKRPEPLTLGIRWEGNIVVATMPTLHPDRMEIMPNHEKRMGIHERFQSLRPHTAMGRLPRLIPTMLDAEDSVEKRWSRINTYQRAASDPTDARYAAALHSLSFLTTLAIRHSGTLPTSVDDLVKYSALAPINLTPVAEEEAELLLQWDGVQAMRYILRYPTGLVDDSVEYFIKLGPGGGVAITCPYEIYEQQVGRPFTTIAAYRLAKLDEIAMPPVAK